MSELIGILDASRVSADNVREYALDYYVQYGYLPSDIQFDNGAYFDYDTYNYLIDLFHPDFHKIAIHKRIEKLKEGFKSWQ